jgi:hypothetical protein
LIEAAEESTALDGFGGMDVRVFKLKETSLDEI